jgi:hypothetical protein
MSGNGATGCRPAVAAAAVLTAAAIVGGVTWLCTLPSSMDGLAMGDYGPGKQREWAQQLMAGLNTRDVAQVPVLRPRGQLLGAQARTIEAAMPAPGCGYELVSVRDRGNQGRRATPDLGENQTYRFDMTVDQHCPAGPPRTRVLGVMAVAEMGYWAPNYFVTA